MRWNVKGDGIMASLKYKVFYEEWLKLYSEGMSIREIARRYNVAKGTVSHIIRKHAEIRPKDKYKDKAEEVYKCYLKGATVQDIAYQLDISESVVRRLLIGKGVTVDSKKLKYAYLADSFIKDYANGMSLREISKKYKVSPQCVSNYLKRDSQVLRDYSESGLSYDVYNDYFDSLDRKKAFYLGVLFASCSLSEVNTSKIIDMCMSRERKELLASLLKRICTRSEMAIKHTDNGSGYVVRINSVSFYDKLEQIGMGKHLPYIDEVYKPYFYKGFFYTNTLFFKNHIAIRAKEEYMVGIINVLKALGIEKYKVCKKGLTVSNEYKQILQDYVNNIR